MFSLWYFSLYSHWSPRFGLRSWCFAYMVFKTEIKQLKATVWMENIVGNISCEGNTKMTSPLCLDAITLSLFPYALYLLTEDCWKGWNFKYQNLLFSFLTCAFIYIYIYIYIYMYIYIHIYIHIYVYIICIYVYVYIYICYIYICVYIYIYFTYIHIYVYIYIYIYIYVKVNY